MSESLGLLSRFLHLIPVEAFEERYAREITEEHFFGFPLTPIVHAEERLVDPSVHSIAYCSMEYGLSATTYHSMGRRGRVSPKNESTDHRVFSNLRAMDYYLKLEADHRMDLPIYSGGLGVLAGDTLKSAADRGVSVVAVGILWNEGYFHQNFWFKDGQIPQASEWDPESYPGLIPLKTRVAIPLKKETLHLRLWKYMVYSVDKTHVVPLVLLDSHIEENSPFAKTLTTQLYRSDDVEHRILQRAILGLGGMKALSALGYTVTRVHLNEGHAALAFVERAKNVPDDQRSGLKAHFAYTCHTPVAAGHDRFPISTLKDVLGEEECQLISHFGQDPQSPGQINLTLLALNTSHAVNAVSKKHQEITQMQFPEARERIQAITNGVHLPTWVSEPLASLLDRFADRIGDWRKEPERLNGLRDFLNDETLRRGIWGAHQANKAILCRLLRHWNFQPNIFTIAWARRIAAYKRPSLLLQDVERLLDIARGIGPLQILFAGKAHPNDNLGATHIHKMLFVIDALGPYRDWVRVVMLENYDTYFAKLLTSGVDVWLNTPLPPFEASGTSGMKAIANAVLQLSTLDGWVVEAADLNIGWIFGWQHELGGDIDERNLRIDEDAAHLYDVLKTAVQLYYQTNRQGRLDLTSEWISKMICAVATASMFNSHRMVAEYEEKIWGAIHQ